MENNTIYAQVFFVVAPVSKDKAKPESIKLTITQVLVSLEFRVTGPLAE